MPWSPDRFLEGSQYHRSLYIQSTSRCGSPSKCQFFSLPTWTIMPLGGRETEELRASAHDAPSSSASPGPYRSEAAGWLSNTCGLETAGSSYEQNIRILSWLIGWSYTLGCLVRSSITVGVQKAPESDKPTTGSSITEATGLRPRGQSLGIRGR